MPAGFWPLVSAIFLFGLGDFSRSFLILAFAKASPDKLNFGSGGNGSAGHLAGEMLKKEAQFFAVHIPYNGGNPAQLALLSGQVDFNIDNLATAAANIQSGKLIPLAVTTAMLGTLKVPTEHPFLSITKGERFAPVAAASVVAKWYRDTLMAAMSTVSPDRGFEDTAAKGEIDEEIDLGPLGHRREAPTSN